MGCHFLLQGIPLGNLAAMWETQVQSLDWEDLLKREMATHSSIFAWKIPWTEEPGSYSLWGCKDWSMHSYYYYYCGC